jgi:DNA-3-methyladenine glycosylase I
MAAVKPSTYCDFVANNQDNLVHKHYHDNEYGYQLMDDRELFGRLILEINQAGLSWTTILNKQDNFRKAFHDYDISKIAKYNEKDRARLLSNAGIIRNRLKVDAVIHNAQQILLLQKENGSFYNWLELHHPKTKDEWVKLFKNTFKFTGGEIVNEFLMSAGFLPGAHHESCPYYKKVLKSKPLWKNERNS